MKKLRLLITVMCMSFLLSVFMVSAAQADSMAFDIGIPNSDIAMYPGPYLHVDVNRTSGTTATFNVTSYLTPNYYYFGGVGGFGVNINGPVTYSDITVTLSDNSAGSYATTGSPGVLDGFGSFNQGVQFDGDLHNVKQLVFTLTLSSGSWNDVNDVFMQNNKGYVAAAHIFPFDADGTALGTGYAGNGNPVPIPAAVWLLGSGLLGLVGIRRRFKK